jgi:hypothetical protein
MKLLRRRILMREYDFNKQRTRYGEYYHRITFIPVTPDELDKLYLIHILKHEPNDKKYYTPKEIHRRMLWRVKDYLYKDTYIQWTQSENEDGFIWIQSKKNAPRTCLGWAVFEYDYE